MAAVSFSSLTSSTLPLSVAARDFLTSVDLLSHSCTLLSLTDLLTLTTVSRLLHSVADSDQLWRPRLQAATLARHTKPTSDSEEQMADNCSEQKKDDTDTCDGSSGSEAEPMPVCTCDRHQYATSCAPCKAQYLSQFQCVFSSRTHCRRLVQPGPLLLVSRGPRNGMVAMMRARRLAGASAAVNISEWHCVRSICPHCVASVATAVKEFYDMRSEWAGSFTMSPPLSVVAVPRWQVEGAVSETATVVDVRYWHVGGYEDVDHRRFTLQWRSTSTKRRRAQQSTAADASGGVDASDSERSAGSSWHVSSMAPFCSGKLAFCSPSNVEATDALRFSRLARPTQQPRQRGFPARVIGAFAGMLPALRERNGQPSE